MILLILLCWALYALYDLYNYSDSEIEKLMRSYSYLFGQSVVLIVLYITLFLYVPYGIFKGIKKFFIILYVKMVLFLIKRKLKKHDKHGNSTAINRPN